MGRPTKHQVRYRNSGRPTVITPEAILKLEQAFAIDASVEEACAFAGISRAPFYQWLSKNPEYKDRIETLRQQPVLKARNTVVSSLNDVHSAQWYLARKKKSEFAERVENTGADGKPLVIQFDDAFKQE